MRVACYFNGKSKLGGAERRIARIFNAIARTGITVDFVFYLYEEEEGLKASYKQVVGDPFLINIIGCHSFWGVLSSVMKGHYDYVFYTGPYSQMLPFFFGGKLSKAHTVFQLVSTGPSVGVFDSMFNRVEFNLVCLFSDIIDCLYPSSFNYLKRLFPNKKIITTPCPFTDLNVFSPSSNKEKRITFLSRWVKGKNADLFVKACLLSCDTIRSKGYKIVLGGGNGPIDIESSIKTIIQNNHLNDIIETPGYIKSETVLPNSEVFISIQDINNYPSQSLIEAISSGCFIIASDEGDTHLIVKKSFGLFCKLTPESISQSIETYINYSEKQKQESAKSAREFAMNTFSMEQSVQHFLSILNNG